MQTETFVKISMGSYSLLFSSSDVKSSSYIESNNSKTITFGGSSYSTRQLVSLLEFDELELTKNASKTNDRRITDNNTDDSSDITGNHLAVVFKANSSIAYLTDKDAMVVHVPLSDLSVINGYCGKFLSKKGITAVFFDKDGSIGYILDIESIINE